MKSNWVVVAGSFALLLMTILVGSSFTRIGGDAMAAGYYGNNYNYGNNPGYAANYNGGQPYSPTGYYAGYNNNNTGYYNNNNYNNNYQSTYYTCANLAVAVSGNRAQFGVTPSVGPGVQVLGYRYAFGDGIFQEGGATMSHAYARPGTFVAKAWVLVSVRGQTKWSNLCQRSVVIFNPNYNGAAGAAYYGNNSQYNNYAPQPSNGTYYNAYRNQPVRYNYPSYGNNNGYNNGGGCTSACGHAKDYDKGYYNKGHQGCATNTCGNGNYINKCNSGCKGNHDKEKDYDYGYDKGHDKDYDNDYDKGYDKDYDNGYDKDHHDEAPVEKDDKNITIDNSSSAVATANVVVNQTPAEPTAIATGYTGGGGGSSSSVQQMPTELPETGNENAVLGLVGVGGLVAAGTAYAASRRELADSIFKRN